MAESIVFYERAREVLEPISTRHPSAAAFLRNADFGRGQSLELLGRYSEAIESYDLALALESDPMRADVLVARARTVARTGRHAEGVAAVESVIADREDDVSVKLYAAPVFAVASFQAGTEATLDQEQRNALAAKYLDRAMELIRQADQDGVYLRRSPTRIEFLKSDPDLELLRSRADFGEFLAELETSG